jgi:hypothetical protein
MDRDQKYMDKITLPPKNNIFMRFLNWIAKGVSRPEVGSGQCKG